MNVFSTLHEACRLGLLPAVELLTKTGLYSQRELRTAAGLAASYGHLHVLKYMDSRGISVMRFTELAIDLFRRNGHYEVVDYIREKKGIK
jgi:hypothetical protein